MKNLDKDFILAVKSFNDDFIDGTYSYSNGSSYVDGEVVENIVTKSIKCFITRPKQGELTSGLATVNDVVILVPYYDGFAFTSGDITVLGTKYYIKQNNGAYSGEIIPLNKLVCTVR